MAFYNERQLNGGQMGSGSGLDADTTDGKNASEMAQDVTGIKGTLLQMIGDISENAYSAKAAQNSYSDVLHDAFVDTSNVSTTAGDVTITSGENGIASFTAGNGTAASNLTDGVQDATDTSEHGIVFKPNTTLLGITVTPDSNSNGSGTYRLYKGESTDSADLIESYNHSMDEAYTFNVILEKGQKYTITEDDGYLIQTAKSFPQTSSDVDVTSGMKASGVDTSYTYRFDSITARVPTGTSGSFTSNTKTLDSTPSTVQVEAQGDIKTNFEAVISDGSGNSITIGQADFGTEKTINFADANVTAQFNYSGTTILKDYGVMFG